MKSLTQHITEKLIVNKDYKTPYNYVPKTFKELRQIIEDRYKEQGSGTEDEPIDFNDIDVRKFTAFFDNDMEIGLFENTEFKYIDISIWDTSNVTDIRYIFNNCKLLKSVALFDTSNIKIMNDMFMCCEKLKSVPSFDTSNAESMLNMFSGCKSLMSVPKLDINKNSFIYGMFYGCDNLDKHTMNIWKPDSYGTPQI